MSKNKMIPRIDRKITDNLSTALFAGGSKRGKSFLLELLTRTEKTMLAKRLAILVLLEQDYSYYRISKLLKVSFSTVARFDRMLSLGNFSSILSAMHHKRQRISAADELELLLTAGGLLVMGGPQYRKRIALLQRRKRGLSA